MRRRQQGPVFQKMLTDEQSADPEKLPREEIERAQLDERQIFGVRYQNFPDMGLGDGPHRKADEQDPLPSPSLSCSESGRGEKREQDVHRENIHQGRTEKQRQ